MRKLRKHKAYDKKRAYKEPVFLFTSSSMRQAAWAGWYSALGKKKLTEKFVHSAHSEWVKELGAGRRYPFLDRYNHDVWKYIPERKLQKLINNFFMCIKAEIKKSKQRLPVTEEGIRKQGIGHGKTI